MSMPFGIRGVRIPQICVKLIQPSFPHLWQLQQTHKFSWVWDLGFGFIEIPNLYQCDGASIPFRLYNQVDPITALPGSFAHDLMYETQCGFRSQFQIFDQTQSLSMTRVDLDTSNPSHYERRARADALLKAFWIASGMDPIMAEKGYIAVRLCGQSAWDSVEPVKPNVSMEDAVLAQTKSNLTGYDKL